MNKVNLFNSTSSQKSNLTEINFSQLATNIPLKKFPWNYRPIIPKETEAEIDRGESPFDTWNIIYNAIYPPILWEKKRRPKRHEIKLPLRNTSFLEEKPLKVIYPRLAHSPILPNGGPQWRWARKLQNVVSRNSGANLRLPRHQREQVVARWKLPNITDTRYCFYRGDTSMGIPYFVEDEWDETKRGMEKRVKSFEI